MSSTTGTSGVLESTIDISPSVAQTARKAARGPCYSMPLARSDGNETDTYAEGSSGDWRGAPDSSHRTRMTAGPQHEQLQLPPRRSTARTEDQHGLTAPCRPHANGTLVRVRSSATRGPCRSPTPLQRALKTSGSYRVPNRTHCSAVLRKREEMNDALALNERRGRRG